MTDPLSPASVRQIHAIIRGALGQAVKWEWIDRNVALLASPPKLRRQPIRPPTAQVIGVLLAKAETDDPTLALAVRLAVATGARRGELCALRWSDVDLEAGVVHIARAVVEVTGRGSVVKAPKSYADRWVSIDAGTVAALHKHRANASQSSDAYILSRHPSGSRPWTPSNLTAHWINLCKAAGAPGIRFHDLRHFSVSHLLDAGISLPAVAARHGHRDANVTLGIYGHAIDERDRQAADLMGRALNP